ncbi:MAG: radical SAM protein [Christensenellaceae bacterium]|nr:radical SAM protein [Christensenellaceae bacterium]
MNDIYAYQYGGKTYINLTNRCNNDCDFCIRRNGDELEGNNLWLKSEPSACQVIDALENMEVSDEVVFCGYGEPTMSLEVLKEVADHLKKQGKKTRLNTNGLANAHYKRNIAPELKGLIDTVSISLNQASAKKYDDVCHSVYGEAAYDYMLDFTKCCVKENLDTVLTVVDVISEQDIETCRIIARDAGATLRVREYVSDNS